MKFVDNAFKYLFKNFLWLFIIFLPVTAFFVTLIQPADKASFILNVNKMEINNFGEILKSFYPFGGMSALYLILFAILFALSLAFFTATSEYHMRTGKFNIKESAKQVLSYFLPSLVICLILLVLSVVINFFIAAITYLTYKLCVIDNVINFNASWVVGISFTLLSLVYAIVGAFLLYSANHIMLNKSTMRESFSLTLLNFDKKFLKYLFSFILPIFVLVPLYVFTPNVWWGAFIYGAAFVLVFMYICSLNLTTFYFINNLERKDLKTYPYAYFK